MVLAAEESVHPVEPLRGPTLAGPTRIRLLSPGTLSIRDRDRNDVAVEEQKPVWERVCPATVVDGERTPEVGQTHASGRG
ncbi:hypothetical protein ACWD4T_43585, partial [Streptomyces umbrinus]